MFDLAKRSKLKGIKFKFVRLASRFSIDFSLISHKINVGFTVLIKQNSNF